MCWYILSIHLGIGWTSPAGTQTTRRFSSPNTKSCPACWETATLMRMWLMCTFTVTDLQRSMRALELALPVGKNNGFGSDLGMIEPLPNTTSFCWRRAHVGGQFHHPIPQRSTTQKAWFDRGITRPGYVTVSYWTWPSRNSGFTL